MEDLSQGGVVAVGTMALTQVLKPYVRDKYISLLPALLGAILGLLAYGFSVDSAIKGIVAGLTASGTYNLKRLSQEA